MSDWQKEFDDWKLTICWLGDPASSRKVSVEELYQAFKTRLEKEAREAAHPNDGCPARHGPASGCVC